MNGIKCPNCALVNMMSANVCHRCRTSLVDLPPTAEVSVPVDETFEAQTVVSQSPQFAMHTQDNELGRKTFFWYRIYLAAMAALYLLVIVAGSLVAYFAQFDNSPDAQEAMIMGIIYALIGIPFALIFAIGLFLPRKPWTWIAGIVYIAISLTSCCFLPVSIPLLIFWLKPETQAYFGRK